MSSGFPPVMLNPSHLACSENGEEKVGSNEWVLAKFASESVTYCMLSVLWSWKEKGKKDHYVEAHFLYRYCTLIIPEINNNYFENWWLIYLWEWEVRGGVVRCCFAEDGTVMYENLYRMCRVIVLLIKPFLLWRSCHLLPLCLLKFPTNLPLTVTPHWVFVQWTHYQTGHR